MPNLAIAPFNPLYLSLQSLLIYRDVLQDEVGQAFLQLMEPGELDSLRLLQAYGRWFQALAERQQGWQDYLISRVLLDDNPFSSQVQQTDWRHLPQPLLAAVKRDLTILQSLYRVDSDQVQQWVTHKLPAFSQLTVWSDRWLTDLEEPPTDRQTAVLTLHAQLASTLDWATLVPDLADYYQQFGAGIWAEYPAFRWHQGQLVGITHPDRSALADLVGYETQRAALCQNTEFLLAGHPALHVLLYGSRGSGKSSLVKSLLTKYGANLRLIEVAKTDLQDLPTIVDRLRDQPQKFIIFVDDLSFEADDEAFKALKVVLEGNLTARPANVVVYATSNRRHLIREFFADRPRPQDADEISTWDTVQEKLSFSDRFGLTLTFGPADQPTYLKIIHHLAQQAQIPLTPEDLEFRALQWATRHNGRSGRTARQFIDFLHSELTVGVQ
jgi:uncharacterized protein